MPMSWTCYADRSFTSYILRPSITEGWLCNWHNYALIEILSIIFELFIPIEHSCNKMNFHSVCCSSLLFHLARPSYTDIYVSTEQKDIQLARRICGRRHWWDERNQLVAFWPREKRMLTESNRRLSRTSGWPRLLSIDAMRLKVKTSLSWLISNSWIYFVFCGELVEFLSLFELDEVC